MSYKKYENADFRIFDFSEGDEEIGGKLIEWELTEKKGGGLGKSPKGFFGTMPGDYPDMDDEEVEVEVKSSTEITAELPN